MSTPLSKAVGLAGGTVIAQAIALAMSPVLTRLYAPSDFGMLATFSVVTGFFPAIACLRYENAIVTAETDSEATDLLVVCGMLALVMSIAIAATALATNHLLSDGAGSETAVRGTALEALLFAASALATGLGAALTATMLREQRFRALSAAKFLPIVATVSLQTALAFAISDGGLGLIVSTILGHLALVLIGIVSVRHTARSALRAVSSVRMPELLHRYRGWPLRELPAALLSAAGLGLPTLLIANKFGNQEAGQFWLAMRVVTIPVSVIGVSLSQAYFAHAARVRRDQPALERFTAETVTLVASCTFPICMSLVLFGEDSFSLVFGAEWSQAGHIAALLAPFLLFWLTFSTIMPLFAAQDRLNLVLVAHVIGASRFLPLLWPGAWADSTYAILAFSLFGACCYAAIGSLLLRHVSSSLGAILLRFAGRLIADWPWLAALVLLALIDASAIGVAVGAVWTLYSAREGISALNTGSHPLRP